VYLCPRILGYKNLDIVIRGAWVFRQPQLLGTSQVQKCRGAVAKTERRAAQADERLVTRAVHCHHLLPTPSALVKQGVCWVPGFTQRSLRFGYGAGVRAMYLAPKVNRFFEVLDLQGS
jgi:hypothetical protein